MASKQLSTEEHKEDIDAQPAIAVNGLSFAYGKDPRALDSLLFNLPRGSRCLLVGDNGAGKTTLLRVLGGKHFVRENEVRILGRRCDFDKELNLMRSYLGGDWGKRTVAFVGFGVQMTADIPCGEMMKDLQEAYPARRARLYELLDINPMWRMHKVSDGQRRRVQIMLGLLRPFELLLLDEITTDLDVVTRQNLLQFLKDETTQRGVTVVYCTHIFDGLDAWPDHVLYLWKGKVRKFGTYEQLKENGDLSARNEMGSVLLNSVAKWITEDRASQPALTDEEKAARDARLASQAIRPDGSAGGYAPGRLGSALDDVRFKSNRFAAYA